MALKHIWKTTLLLSQGRCQHVQGRIDERIVEALRKENESGFGEVVIRRKNPTPENVSFSKNSSSGG